MITKNMIHMGYTQGVVQLVISPNNDGIVCQIGDGWFYFGGCTAEEYDSVEAYKRDTTIETIVSEIYVVLNEFSYESEFKDEYDYYEAFLRENIVEHDWDHNKVWNAIHELSDIRAAYNVFDMEDRKKYRALSMGIEALRMAIREVGG